VPSRKDTTIEEKTEARDVESRSPTQAEKKGETTFHDEQTGKKGVPQNRDSRVINHYSTKVGGNQRPPPRIGEKKGGTKNLKGDRQVIL